MSKYTLAWTTPDKVVEYWDDISGLIAATLPPYVLVSLGSLNTLLKKVIDNKVQVWIGYISNDSDTDASPYGLLLTTVTIDECTGSRSLLILLAASFGLAKPDLRIYLRGLETLKRYAKKLGCSKIIAYTNSEKLVKFCMDKLGWNSSYVLTYDMEE